MLRRAADRGTVLPSYQPRVDAAALTCSSLTLTPTPTLTPTLTPHSYPNSNSDSNPTPN